MSGRQAIETSTWESAFRASRNPFGMRDQSLRADSSHVVVFRDVDTSMEIDVANRVLSIGFKYADGATIQIDLDELSGEFPKIAESLADTLDTPVDDEVDQSVSIEPVRRPLEGNEPNACYRLRQLVSVVVEGDTLRLEWRNEGSCLSRFLNVFGESRPNVLTYEQSAKRNQIASSLSDIIGSANVVGQT